MYHFTKLEARGFKSFADKVEIPFRDGVTAIIGPNGCGKSNVAEAIKWALGEQSAKSLRGNNMRDVIFAGTTTRKSMSYCEVSLFFDNSDHTLFPTMPFDEVVVTRKLDRSDGSEYLINHTRCHYRDIVNLFRDTGLGKEGYSIIQQGRVSEIISAKPSERRKFFEDAAGIATFRSQRAEAQRDLDKTTANLDSANNIIGELERQIAPLRRQAEAAKKYFELKDQLKTQEVNLYIYNYENNQKIKQKIYDKIDATTKELKEKEVEYNRCVNDYEKCIQDSANIDRVYDESNAELLSLKVDAERVQGQANVVKERISHLQSEQTRLYAELQSVDSRLIFIDDMIKKAQANKEAELSLFLETSRKYEDLNTKLEFLSKSLKGQESDLETKNLEYVQAIEELGNLKSSLSGLMAEKSINEERSKNLRALLNAKKSKLDEELTNLTIYDGNVKKTKETLRELMVKNNECLSEKIEATEAIKGISEDIKVLNSKLGMAEGNLKLQITIKDDFQGYQESVKRLMQDAKYDPMLKNRIMGVLAEVINVPEGYESAIEFSLGAALQNVLVESERDAAALITYLKQKNYGRVTFRPLSSCRPRPFPIEYRGALTEQGSFGLASNLVTCEKRYEPFIEALLGSTVVVDNMMTAERLYKQYNQGFKIVTLDGEIYSRGGEITGGSRRTQNSGILSQEKIIEQARNTVEKHKSNIAGLTAQREEREREIEVADQTIEQLSKQISELRIASSLNEEKSKQSAAVVEQLQKEIADDAVECERVQEALKDLTSKISSIDVLEATVKDKQAQYGSLLETSKSKSSEQKNERELMAEEVMNLRLKRAGHQNALDGYESELFRLQREDGSTQEEKFDLIAELKSVESNIESIKTAPEKTSFSKEDLARIKELEAEIAFLSERKRSLSDKIVELDADKTRIFNEKNVLSEKKIRDEGMIERIDDDNRYLQEHILEEYNLTYTSALPLRVEEFEAYGAKTVIADLKKSISKLGEVNPLAVESLAEAETRHTELVTQRDDIMSAYDDIMKVITELTAVMSTKFTEAFEQINKNFQRIFSEVFDGGRGELRLDFSETDDPLESGIDIFSQPPGKKLQNISLLSGGEKAFTAISILFAILELKPMPFCILDEIEAALDDANANLFAEFLKRYSTNTQFIVITHRKPTMRHADRIFGVTMEERGVTKIVSIEFEDAIKHASSDN